MATTEQSKASQPDVRERIAQFGRHSLEQLADQVHVIDQGTVLQSPSKPGVYDLNHVRIARPVSFDEALALAERHQSHLSFRYIVVEHEPALGTLDEPFAAAGWEVDRDLLMALTGRSDREVATDAVIEIGEDEMASMMGRWHRDEDPDTSAEVVAALAEYSRLQSRVLGDRRFGTVLDGELAAVTLLRSDGTVAQVEDVYTVPHARGRGFARALVSHAVELARAGGHELIFITADDDNWPKQLYAQIGFEPVGRMRSFLSRPKPPLRPS